MVITTVKITSGSAKWSDTCMNVSDSLTFFDRSHAFFSEAQNGFAPRKVRELCSLTLQTFEKV